MRCICCNSDQDVRLDKKTGYDYCYDCRRSIRSVLEEYRTISLSEEIEEKEPKFEENETRLP